MPRMTPKETQDCRLAEYMKQPKENLINANLPVNPQLKGSFDTSIIVCISDLALAGPAENE